MLSLVANAAADPFDAPAGYYAAATGTGSTLESQLRTIMSNGHVQRRYGDFRQSAAITDRDPNNPSNILLAYTRASVPSGWDSGSTWNREHTWPQSRQPGSASNGTRGNLGDPHALRPANPQVNSNRGNDPFGTPGTTGSNGSVGSYYYPGDVDAGDTARQLFYSAVRYSANGLSLVSGFPSGNQMGDLDALVEWHYADAPDEFERRRNHTIYSQALNPSYYTNNRNAFVDHPEFVWSVFVDQQNDTRLTIAGSGSADGSSSQAIDLGRVYVGGAGPVTATVNVSKSGVDGTYYGVTAVGDAFHNAGDTARAIATGSIGGAADSFTVGLDANSTASGVYGGFVVVDNLDVTTQGGVGRGANDGDDVASLTYTVLDHPIASFNDTVFSDSLTVDFGDLDAGQGTVWQSIDLFNFDGIDAPGFAADLDLDAITGSALGIQLAWSPTAGIEQGESSFFDVGIDTSLLGSYGGQFSVELSDEDLPGEMQFALDLTVLGTVVPGVGAADYNSDGLIDAADYTVYRDDFGSTIDLAADGDASGEVDAADYTVWADHYGEAITPFLAVPEPSAATLAVLAAVSGARRRRR